MGGEETWRELKQCIRRAARSLKEEAEAHKNTELESETRRLGEELLDIIQNLDQLQQRSETPPPLPADLAQEAAEKAEAAAGRAEKAADRAEAARK
jgi:hypothetical protein